MKIPTALTFILLAALVLSRCLETQSSRGHEKPEIPAVQAIADDSNDVVSLFGITLPAKQMSTRTKRQREEDLISAREMYETNPDVEENIIWYGRRLAYLGQYNEAIRIYSLGLDKFPNSYRLLRHRGHRYITTRKFSEAIEDLQKAAFYARTSANEVEQDGLPNRLNKPLSNVKFNIWYHLGIAYYLKGNYDKAISSFKKCQTFCDNDDLKVAVADWFYMTYRKIGNTTAASELLIPINKRMTIVENYAYHQRLLMYKGVYDAEALLKKAESTNESINPTLGYGIGNWYLYNGNIEKARAIFQRIILNPNWDAFGYIAAEVDLQALNSL